MRVHWWIYWIFTILFWLTPFENFQVCIPKWTDREIRSRYLWNTVADSLYLSFSSRCRIILLLSHCLPRRTSTWRFNRLINVCLHKLSMSYRCNSPCLRDQILKREFSSILFCWPSWPGDHRNPTGSREPLNLKMARIQGICSAS